MDQTLVPKILVKIGVAIAVVALADLVFLNYWFLKNQDGKSAEGDARPVETIASPTPLASPSPTPTREPEVKTVETKTVVEKQTETIVQTAQKEIFIPMGSGSTKGRNFSELTGTDVTIDTTKYANIESVVFEASIWVEGGNGAAYAQLYNVNDKTGYIESQISNNTGTPVGRTSGKVPIPQGQRTYRVQAKTDLVEFAAQVSNARIKITLK